MSKYDSLWTHVAQCPEESLTLTFQQIGEICGVPVDHSFLRYKKDLPTYGWQVQKISIKEQTVRFVRTVV